IDLTWVHFAAEAALHFADHPEHHTYTTGEIGPGGLLALRWGLGADCVLVLRLTDEPPLLFGNTIDMSPGVAAALSVGKAAQDAVKVAAQILAAVHPSTADRVRFGEACTQLNQVVAELSSVVYGTVGLRVGHPPTGDGETKEARS
ncbi:MAG: hypothetical protein Q8R28_02130, partial [Dehalococcoidia bacterium]|nr:hypothetical protein [Dehalococcoidia bacterium]